jgi:hypothetical protein
VSSAFEKRKAAARKAYADMRSGTSPSPASAPSADSTQPEYKKLYKTHQWTRKTVPYVVEHAYGICYICGHGGANSADHEPPVGERADPIGTFFDLDKLYAIHAWPKRCPVCNCFCQSIKSMGSVERAKRRVAEIAGSTEPPEPEGRDF